MENASFDLPSMLWEGNLVVQAASLTKDDHSWAGKTMPYWTTLPFFSRDELIDAFTCLPAKKFLVELDETMKKIPLDDIQDPLTVGTHLGDLQISDAVQAALVNLKAYARQVAGEADESGTGPRRDGSVLAPHATSTLASSSRTENVLANMDDRLRLAILVDKAVEMVGPIPRDVYEVILHPAEANRGLSSVLDELTVEQLIHATVMVFTDSPRGVSEEIHRILLFAVRPGLKAVPKNVHWKLEFKSTIIHQRVLRQLVLKAREEPNDYCKMFGRTPFGGSLVRTILLELQALTQDHPVGCHQPIEMDHEASVQSSSSTHSSS
ncbi:hypothetical protein AAF712_005512 [Marasmius tenuissimus]|uniref:Uncharacterized protein n=1 Tax=Marasmius tenuissimus TaxID=585030 RepID=A0ABR3A0I4_9AGAR